MKLPTNHITTLARDVFARKQRPTKNRMINPRRDWGIGLLCGVGILIGIMAWSAYMYITNRSGENFQTAETVTDIPVYRASIVNDALEAFRKKEELFNTIQSQTLYTPPPVLEQATDSVDVPDNIDDGVEDVSTSTTPVTETTSPVDQAAVVADEITENGSEPELSPTLSE